MFLGRMALGLGTFWELDPPSPQANQASGTGAEFFRVAPTQPATLHTMHCLAYSLMRQGNFAEAEPLYRSALEGRRRALGPAHVKTLESADGLATMCTVLRALGEEVEPH